MTSTHTRIPDDEVDVLLPLRKMRRTIAARIVESLRSAPHVTSVAEADFTTIA